jgi:tetratricopeptide (TPR) repeat protein
MKLFRKTIGMLAAGACLAWSTAAVAHDGPEHEIDELTDRIKIEGESADLLLQRAIEYNVLGKSAEAIKDLERALNHDAESPIIHLELSRAFFATGKTNEAFDTASRGLKLATEPPAKAALLLMRADITRARKDYAKALDYVDRALAEQPDIVEAYLSRSQLQQLLGQKKERIKGLEKGIEVTGSGLLEGELLDAFIEGGKADVAMTKIEAELKDARWRGTWLIRRAKVHLSKERYDEADADLEDAIEELDKRLGRGANDPLLLVDRGLAFDLLGKKEDAKKDYESARKKGVNEEWVRERIRALSDDKKRDAKKDGKKRDDDPPDKKDDKSDDDDKDKNKGDNDEDAK